MPVGRPYERHINDDLVRELKRLILLGFHATPALKYTAVRDEICGIHIEMNLRQQHAPRFRPMHRLARVLRTDDEVAESLDRQVIDLHWRAHSANKPTAPANNYPTIFDDNPFDLGAAERFAQEVWSHSAKAVHLHLTDDMQWENATIQIRNIQKVWATIDRGYAHGDTVKQAGAPHIEKKLREAVRQRNKPQVERSIPGMVDAWKARKIVGDSPTRVAGLIALMTGNKPRDPRAVKRTLESFDAFFKKAP
jgi:hypothetical protein